MPYKTETMKCNGWQHTNQSSVDNWQQNGNRCSIDTVHVNAKQCSHQVAWLSDK